MADPPEDAKPPLHPRAANMADQVGIRAARMTRRGDQPFLRAWRAVATIGLIGWSVVLPMLAGIAVGGWIDHRWPSRFSWTLMLLVGGLGLGCASAWSRIKSEQEDK